MQPDAFIARWSAASANERSNSQPFLCELCDLLGVERPHNTFETGYAFEFPVPGHHPDGSTSERRIDLYRRACFVLESKQFQAAQPQATPVEKAAAALGAPARRKSAAPTRGTDRWDDAMTRARGQAERYIHALPASEPNPPFLILIDVGATIELYADFTQAGKTYLPFPDTRRFRIRLADLRDDSVRERLRLIWTDPLSLDPSRKSAEVTREIAHHLAELAKSLESAGHPPQAVADFLSRCLFCMFAEDVGLLPPDSFRDLLLSLPDDGEGFQPMLQHLFREMNTGTGYSTILRKKLLQFNGGLFADDTVLPVDRAQLHLLRAASKLNWRNVEPAIFGTLLERALNPRERHKLGAHYTPRAYVERLVLPTVIEPLRAEWDAVRAAALTHARLGKVHKAIQEIREWHHHLCQVKVLDPACGSGNFLYVTLEHMKRLEGEVLLELEKYGDQELTFEMQHFSVDPHQFLGIEVNPRAASIAELVLWIGYLQWHFRTRGQTMPAEPIIKKFKNIECRDAVLAWDGDPEPQRDEQGQEITIWDRRSYKTDPVTGREIPDESKRIPLLTYKNPRPAEWPQADYIIGNPPFLGPARMRESLGDSYSEVLRSVYPEVPESADFVMFWWNKAADLSAHRKCSRFGLITTNSLRQRFNRRVVQSWLTQSSDNTSPVSLVFAIPDHPWVDTDDGADVRIAMTVGGPSSVDGELLTVLKEEAQQDGSCAVTFSSWRGRIQADLTIGANVSDAVGLVSNSNLSSEGVKPHGMGFVVNQDDAKALGLGEQQGLDNHIRPYINGRDLTEQPRGALIIDLFGLSDIDVRHRYPKVYQHILTSVKPDRDAKANTKDGAAYAKLWWIFGKPRQELRRALSGMERYIVTVKTAKHRVFQFVDERFIADSKLIVFAFEDAFFLGVLSSSLHCIWALRSGSWLGVGNDPTYVKSAGFEKFPFPDCTEPQRDRIRKIAEELDVHRKLVQAQHPGLTLTGMYNVLEKLRASQPLTPRERDIHDKGLVSVLKQLHDELDAAVFDAYGWPQTLTDAEILERLVQLNAERAREEAQGHIRWLRPDYQIPLFQKKSKTAVEPAPSLNLPIEPAIPPASRSIKAADDPARASSPKSKIKKQPWPKTLPERAKAIETALRAAAAPVTPESLAKQFHRANPADITEILETLCALGKARKTEEHNTYAS